MAFGLPLTMPSRNTLTPGCYNLRIMSAISAQSYWDASISIERRAPIIAGTRARPASFIYIFHLYLSFTALSPVPGRWNSLPTAENHNSVFSSFLPVEIFLWHLPDLGSGRKRSSQGLMPGHLTLLYLGKGVCCTFIIARKMPPLRGRSCLFLQRVLGTARREWFHILSKRLREAPGEPSPHCCCYTKIRWT